jgi:hypothetical protein
MKWTPERLAERDAAYDAVGMPEDYDDVVTGLRIVELCSGGNVRALAAYALIELNRHEGSS